MKKMKGLGKIGSSKMKNRKMRRFFTDGGLKPEEIKDMKEPFPVNLSFDQLMSVIRYNRRIYPSIVVAVLGLQIACIMMMTNSSANFWIAVFCIGLLVQFICLVMFRRSAKNDAKKIVPQIVELKSKIK